MTESVHKTLTVEEIKNTSLEELFLFCQLTVIDYIPKMQKIDWKNMDIMRLKKKR